MMFVLTIQGKDFELFEESSTELSLLEFGLNCIFMVINMAWLIEIQ